MKNPFQNESFSRLAILVFLHALFMILRPAFDFVALILGMITGSYMVLNLCQVILMASIPFLIALISAKKGQWWWLIAVPVQFLFYLGLEYIYDRFIIEYEYFQILDGTIIYTLVPLIGQAAGIVVRLLHRKRE